MNAALNELSIYLHLARAAELRRRPLERDRLLVIAASKAMAAELPRIAAWCRRTVLAHNPGHMLRRWERMSDAVADGDFQQLLVQLERQFPREKAEQMLHSLGVDRANERAVYYDDEEYAASIWGLAPAQLEAGGAADDASAE